MAKSTPGQTVGDSRREPSEPLSHLFVRLGWMLFGNVLLVAAAISILLMPPWSFTLRDGLFWIVAASLVVLRYVDVTRLGGLTAEGAPATRRHLARYAAGVAALSAVIWILAQSFQGGS